MADRPGEREAIEAAVAEFCRHDGMQTEPNGGIALPRAVAAAYPIIADAVKAAVALRMAAIASAEERRRITEALRVDFGLAADFIETLPSLRGRPRRLDDR